MDVSKSFFLSVKRSFEEFCFFETFLPTDVKLGRVEVVFFKVKEMFITVSIVSSI